MKTNIAVREIDEEVFRKFKAKTIDEDMKLGEALTLAMKFWLMCYNLVESVVKLRNFTKSENL